MSDALKLLDHNSLKVYLKLIAGSQGKHFSPLTSLVSSGNHKLPRTTGIFNMGSATDCPSRRLGLCQAFANGKCICYALKAEREYRPFTLPFRRRQEIYWKNTPAKKFATDFVTMNMLKVRPYNALRLNESGDFWSQECVGKAEKIARILKRYGITTYCYTARSDLDFSRCKRLVVSGSGFCKEGIKGEFLMVKDVKVQRPRGYGVCVSNCRTCSRCLVGRKTVIAIH
jgi:hypothetical protein